MRLRTHASILTAVLLAAVSTAATAYPRPGSTEQASLSSTGVRANRPANLAALSADGSVVAFMSSATNLVPGDHNALLDIYARDRDSGTTQRVSAAIDGGEANGHSITPALSADGRYVALRSSATNLVTADANGAMGDVFVRDRDTGAMELVSVTTGGAAGNQPVSDPAISADGRYVAFSGAPTNLVPGDTNGWSDVFVHDRETDITQRVSVATDEVQGNNPSSDASLSADGRYVAFVSSSTNLAAGDSNGQADVFVRDRVNGVTERVSLAGNGAQTDAGSADPGISADGRYVVFRSAATNLVPGDANALVDIFVRDRLTATTERVSVASDGSEGNGASDLATISGQGRFVAFRGAASNLVAGDANAKVDVFVHDRETRSTERVSIAALGAEANGASDYPSASADGRHIAFDSAATNLVPGVNLETGVYVRDRGAHLDVLGDLAASAGPDGVQVSGRATLAGMTLSSASDPGDDGTTGAGALGAQLAGAELIGRPEQEDLLLRLSLSSLPSAPQGSAGLPAILYGLDLVAGGSRFQVRALRAGATVVPPRTPFFMLYRCDGSCVEDRTLSGSIGSTGGDVLVSIPLAALGGEGVSLSGLVAFTAAGEAATAALQRLDEVGLPAATIPVPRVEIATTPASQGADEVAWATAVPVVQGAFTGTIEGPPPAAGDRAWARACLGPACGAPSSVPL